MNRYGDTPQGMVESALEFARVCRKNDFHDIVFSMKASNPQVMILAYRLLVAEMIKLGWNYPLHLGVTEAGLGEDGRIKSAMGIGSLLLDGLGDTIRVSLTEDPWFEIDPCKRLVQFGESYLEKSCTPFTETHRNIEQIQKRSIILPKNLAMHRDGTVILSVSQEQMNTPDLFKKLGCEGSFGTPKLKNTSADSIVIKGEASSHIKQLADIGVGIIQPITLSEAIEKAKISRFSINKTSPSDVVIISNETPKQWEQLEQIAPALICLTPKNDRLHYCRSFFEWLQNKKMKTPVILNFHYDCSQEDLVIQAAAECGALFCDGLGDGIWLEGDYDLDVLRQLSFGILQAARMRIFKTDFISCPSCGRTLFNLQDVTKRIQARTQHLAGVKIAIMGCIVNGPGEMADADFGYVGSKPGKIDLYVGKECVEKDIDFAEADDRLVALIKSHGRWVEESSCVPQ
jgi:(E)-4-hydroxy-3-methylbut-2-enyl-diphosphate synthase